MIGVIFRAPRTSSDNELFERFKHTAGIIASYQLVNDAEVMVVTIWESAEKREAYMKTPLQAEIIAANPAATREVFEVQSSKT